MKHFKVVTFVVNRSSMQYVRAESLAEILRGLCLRSDLTGVNVQEISEAAYVRATRGDEW
jgi:hypothetical protein